MKKTVFSPAIYAIVALSFVSCTQMNTVKRVNDRPYRPIATSTVTEQPTGMQYVDFSSEMGQSSALSDPGLMTPQLNAGYQATTPTQLSLQPSTPNPYITGTPQTSSSSVVPTLNSNTNNSSPTTTASTATKYPVATQVPGDPTRVYSPSDPTKTVKIVDRFGNRQKSGKKLYDPYAPAGTKVIFLVP